MRIRHLIAACIALAAVSACSSGKPAQPHVTKASPISQADLARVAHVLCEEPVAAIAHVLDGVSDVSVARMQRVVLAMGQQCPSRLDDLTRYDNSGRP